MMHIEFTIPRIDFELSVNLDLPPDGVTAIFGKSGSGKTSILRCIAGLEHPQKAHIKIAGITWQNDIIFLPVWKRNIGYVPQEPYLFTHCNIYQNLIYGRSQEKREKLAIESIIDIFQLSHLLKRYPQNLSTGEKQRTAMARAIINKPCLLLLDEPLSALDDEHRWNILKWLKELQIPMIYVSHAMEEVLYLAKYLAILRNGEVIAKGKDVKKIFMENNCVEQDILQLKRDVLQMALETITN